MIDEPVAAKHQRALVDLPLVRAHLVAAAAFLVVALAAGFFYSLAFLQAYPFEGIPWLAAARVRMLHTNLVLYGFLVNAFVATLVYAVPHLTGNPLTSARLGRVAWFAWQVAVALVAAGLLAGSAQAIEGFETPIRVDPLLVATGVLFCIQFLPPLARPRGRSLGVPEMFFALGLVALVLSISLGNFLGGIVFRGVSGAAATGLFLQELTGLFATAMGWGLASFIVPRAVGRPLFRRGLSVIGFWGIAVCFPLGGAAHFLHSPVPRLLQVLGVGATMVGQVAVSILLLNLFLTLRRRGRAERPSEASRWFFTGAILYAVACVAGALQVTFEAQAIVHFSDWEIGQAHLVLFGVFTLWINGAIVSIWPEVCGAVGWFSGKLNGWALALTTLGIVAMVLALSAAGIVQGFLWKELAPWESSLVSSMPFWWARTIAGGVIILGQLALFINMWWTALEAPGRGSATPGPAAQGD